MSSTPSPMTPSTPNHRPFHSHGASSDSVHNQQLGFQTLHSLNNASPSPSSKLFALSLEHAQLQRDLSALGGTSLLEMRDCLAEKDGEISNLVSALNSCQEETRKLRRNNERLLKQQRQSGEGKKDDEGGLLRLRAKASLEESLHEIVALRGSLDGKEEKISCLEEEVKRVKTELRMRDDKVVNFEKEIKCLNSDKVNLGKVRNAISVLNIINNIGN